MSLQDRKNKGYLSVLKVCECNNVTPQFDETSYRGQTENINGSTQSVKYPVKCNKCGIEYLAWFKASGKNPKMQKCPQCSTGHKDLNFSFSEAQKEASVNNLSILDSIESWKGKSTLLRVKCLNCGMEFKTSFKHNHLNNCPYCKESSSEYNQLEKLNKICLDNLLTLVSEEYTPGLKYGRPKYKVKCNVCGTEYLASFIGHKVTNCPQCCERKVRSNRERLVCALLDEHNIKYLPNYRLHGLKISNNVFELDIFIPELNIAFEFNGQAYHNSGNGVYSKDRNYHKNKTEICLKNGIKLYHLWDYISDELCISIIKSKLGLSKRIFARKTQLATMNEIAARNFFEQNHVDGHVKSNYYFCLLDKGVIVAALSLLNRRLQASKSSAWEIGRFATVKGYTVVGGYSKLLNFAMLTLKKLGVNYLVSYCNRDLSPDPQATFYYKYGFKYLGDSGKIYWYWASHKLEFNGKVIKHGERCSRQLVQKQKLIKHYKDNNLVLPKELTELSLAEGLGLYPCYNSGNFKYVLDL